MYETNMSDLVVQICKEYSEVKGLSFPPCAQQEINAICAWVDETIKALPVSVKDLTASYGESTITFHLTFTDGTVKSLPVPVTQYVTISANDTSGSISSDKVEILLNNGNNILVKNNRYYRHTLTYGSVMYYTAVDGSTIYEVDVDTNTNTWTYTKIALSETYVDFTSAQTISGVKTFSDHIKTPQVANSNGNALVREKSAEGKSVFGNDSSAAVLMGNTDRPYYSKSGSDFTGVGLALKSDIAQTSDLTYCKLVDVNPIYLISGIPGLYIVQAWDTSNNLTPYTVKGLKTTTDVYMTFLIVTKNKTTRVGAFDYFFINQTASTSLLTYFQTDNYTGNAEATPDSGFFKLNDTDRFVVRALLTPTLPTK